MKNIFQYYRPTLGQSWLMVALLLVGGVVIGVLLPNAPQSLTYTLMMLLPIAFCWLMARQAATVATAETRVTPLNKPRFGKLGAAGFMVLAAVALLFISVVIEPTTAFLPMPDFIKDVFEKAFVDTPMWDLIISTCIMAPLLEEFLCRGMMERGMLTRMKPWKAIAWSAFIFAFMHANPWQSIPAFLIGLFLGWVYWRTHCLWATIALHCLNNSISAAITRIWPDLPVDAGLSDILPSSTYWIIYAASVVALAAVLCILNEKTLSPEIQASRQA